MKCSLVGVGYLSLALQEEICFVST
jgi:hypothetical protein